MRVSIFAFVVAACVALAPVAASAQQIVMVRPPRAHMEQRGPRPGPNHQWVPGFQEWRGNRHQWNPGRWEQPPQAGAHWGPPVWAHHGRGWMFTPGRWR